LIEEKGSLFETQARFRKERGIMVNVIILQQIINKEISRKGGKMYGHSIDLNSL